MFRYHSLIVQTFNAVKIQIHTVDFLAETWSIKYQINLEQVEANVYDIFRAFTIY